MRGEPAGARECACARGCRALGAPSPRWHRARVPLRAWRQGHVDPAADASRTGAHMSPREHISTAVRAAASRGEPALVAYLTAGFPSRGRFGEHLRTRAAAQEVSLAWIREALVALGEIRSPLLLRSYLNPLLPFGVGRLAASAAA